MGSLQHHLLQSNPKTVMYTVVDKENNHVVEEALFTEWVITDTCIVFSTFDKHHKYIFATDELSCVHDFEITNDSSGITYITNHLDLDRSNEYGENECTQS